MSIINLILLSLLILKITSLDDSIDNSVGDRKKCEQANHSGEVTTEKCNSITPTLESTGEYKGECCRLSIKNNPFLKFKKFYGENWKTIVCQMFGLDENISEKDILKIFGLKNDKIENTCLFLNPNYIKIQLYSISSYYETNINYNCGDGEETYNSKDFIPSNDFEKKYKDILDCQIEPNEKLCSKKAFNLSTDNVQCCWCEMIEKGGEYESQSQSCDGYPFDGLEEEIKNHVNENNKGNEVIYNCSCYHKNGKITKVSANSITGEVIIE